MKEIEKGAHVALRSRVSKTIIRGVTFGYKRYWKLWGSFDPYIVTGGYEIALGVALMYLLLAVENVRIGLAGFVPNEDHQLFVAIIFIVVGFLTSATRRQEVLFVAVMLNLFYALSTIEAMLTGYVSIIAMTAVIYMLYGTIAISAYASTRVENLYLHKRLSELQSKQTKLEIVINEDEHDGKRNVDGSIVQAG